MFIAFTGQTVEVPVQNSGISHPVAAGLQTAEVSANPLAGQAAEDPVQDSATSHTPLTARQVTDDGRKESVGQAA